MPRSLHAATWASAARQRLRHWAFYMGELGSPRRSFPTMAMGQTTIESESAEFAAALGQALNVLFRPWFSGQVDARKFLLGNTHRALYYGLDSQSLLYWGKVEQELEKGTMQLRPVKDGGYILERVRPEPAK